LLFPEPFRILALRGEFAVDGCIVTGPEQVTKYLLPISLDENGTVQTVSMVLRVYVLPVTRFFWFVFFLVFFFDKA